ncbi:MAG: T9SS type A sorting domain-containing protein [Bacteroidota bacterium]
MKTLYFLLWLFFIGLPISEVLGQVPFLHDLSNIVYSEQATPTALEDSVVFLPTIHQQYYQQYLSEQSSLDVENWLGFTIYDHPSNGTLKKSIGLGPDGNPFIAWNYHSETSDPPTVFPLLGSIVSSPGDTFPIGKLEEVQTTRGPNLLITSSGKQLILTSSRMDHQIWTLRKAVGSSDWMEAPIPSEVDLPLSWVHAAAAGSTIHAIAMTWPENTTIGGIYKGQSGALLYFRSTDEGETWDIQDHLIPEIDSTAYTGFHADRYTIEARGDKVAIGIFHPFGDVVLLESATNGALGSWTKRLVKDFPLDLHQINSPYTIDDIGGVDPQGPSTDELAIESTDGLGAIAIEPDGTVHVVFGRAYVSDADQSNQGIEYYYGYAGLFYWNTDMPDATAQRLDFVEEALDVDGNGLVELQPNLPVYRNGITSMPSLEVCDNGLIVLAYTQMMENFVFNNPTLFDLNFRHVYLSASWDGENWTTPYDLINPEVAFFPQLVPLTEGINPDLKLGEDNRLHITYQKDDWPGVWVLEMPYKVLSPSNVVAYWSVDLMELFDLECSVTVATTSPKERLSQLDLYPNPSGGQLFYVYELESTSSVSYTVFDMMGRQLLQKDLGRLPAGAYRQELSTEDFSGGAYLFELTIDGFPQVQQFYHLAND